MAPGVQNTRVSDYNPTVIFAATAPMLLLPIVIVALRFWCRRISRTPYLWDDWTCLISLILVVGGSIPVLISAAIGDLGEHQKLSPDGELMHYPGLYVYEKTRYAILLLATPNLGLVKISILLFYHRLFDVRLFRRCLVAVMIVIGAWALAYTLAVILQCRPPHLFWELFEIDYQRYGCINVQAMYASLAYTDLIFDAVVLVVPFPIIWSLNMPIKRKIAVLDLLGLNVIVIGSGIARLVSFQTIINQTSADPIGFFHDTTWWTAGPLFWQWCETAVAIIGCCLPTLAPLWRTRRGAKSLKGSMASSWGRSQIQRLSRTPNKDDTSDEVDSIPLTSSRPHMVSQTITDIRTDSLPPHELPEGAIRVDKTFGASVV